MDTALIVDIILAAIFAACVYIGAKNGFVRSVCSLLASVVALCASLFVVMQFSPLIATNFVNPWIASKIEQHMEEKMDESALETVDSLLSTTQKIFVSLSELLESGEETSAEEKKTEVQPETTEELIASLSATIGSSVTAVLMFLILFALFWAILRVLIDQLRFINKIPIVGPANVLLGMALGAVTGCIILIVPLWLIMYFVPSVFNVSAVLDPALFEKSRILSLLVKFVPWDKIPL